MEINVMDENEVRHMYMQGYTVKQIGEIMYKQAQKTPERGNNQVYRMDDCQL